MSRFVELDLEKVRAAASATLGRPASDAECVIWLVRQIRLIRESEA